MHRRQFLSGLGAAGAVLVLPGCSTSASGPPAAGTPNTLQVINASQGYVPGAQNWVALGVLDDTGTPVDDADIQVWLRTVPTGADAGDPEVLAGPLDMTWADPAQTGAPGLYYAQMEIGDPGLYEFVAVRGDDHGTAAAQVLPGDQQTVPMPGDEAPSVATATDEEDLGYFAVCTQDPPCGMHEMSLDGALETGRPIVLMFATPQFCQTAVCGPSVATLDQIRQDGDWGDTIFIHAEIFAEAPTDLQDPAGASLREAVQAYGLPSEPWVFTIDGDGGIVDRHDGAMPEGVLQSLIESLTA